jgi:UDP-glucose 4-epimerase
MKILVSGGAGFIGSHIVEHFHKNAEVRVIDDLRTGKTSNIDGFDVEFIEGSILDRELLKQSMQGVDFVFHLAAMVSIPECIEKPEECFDINAEGTKYVLEEAANAGVRKVCLSTTCAIYGNNPQLPKTEDMTPEPIGPYAQSKLKAEAYCNEFTESGKLQTACLRYFNVFGPRQDPKSPYAAAVPIFVSLAVKNKPITIYGDGEQTRDFVYVKDVVGANVFMAENDSTGIYNVAYGNQTSVKDLAEMIVEITGSESEIIHTEPRDGEVKYSMASIEKLRDQGFSPSSEFREGLEETIRFFS